jgi:DNA-binding Xre family transcriptional regulator
MSKQDKEKPMSTYDELMQDPEFKKMYKKSYLELVLSELVIAIMNEDNVSIRSLAKQAGISPTIVQDVRSGKKENLNLRTFSSLIDALGYDIVLEKRKEKKIALPKRIKMRLPHRRRSLQNA